MQILHPLIQWKPHSCILNMKDNFDTMHGSKDLHLPKSHCKLKPGALGCESMGCNRHPIRALESFHYEEIFAYDQQVSFYLKMSYSKDQISTQFMHRSLWEISTSQKQRD